MRLRDEFAEKYISISSPEITRFTMSWHFKDGFDACEAHYLPMIEKLESALKKSIEFGEYAEWAVDKYKDIQQLDIDARQTLAELAEFKLKMNGEKNDSTK